MNPTLHNLEPIHVIALTDRIQPSPPLAYWSPKRPALGRMELFSIRVTNALSALGATPRTTFAHDVVHTLRCHFITTTKLSKSCQPTRFSNWRNHESNNPSGVLSTAKKPRRKVFRRPCFPCHRLPNTPNPWQGLRETRLNYIGRRTLDNPPQNDFAPQVDDSSQPIVSQHVTIIVFRRSSVVFQEFLSSATARSATLCCCTNNVSLIMWALLRWGQPTRTAGRLCPIGLFVSLSCFRLAACGGDHATKSGLVQRCGGTSRHIPSWQRPP